MPKTTANISVAEVINRRANGGSGPHRSAERGGSSVGMGSQKGTGHWIVNMFARGRVVMQ